MITNNGSFLENVINMSINFFLEENIAYFWKKKGFLVNQTFLNQSGVDYFGLYKKKFIALEAKSCKSNFFYFKNISKFQIKELNQIIKFNGFCFLVIYCFELNKYYCFNFKIISQLIKTKKTKMDLKKYQQFLIFIRKPFYLDFLTIINDSINQNQ